MITVLTPGSISIKEKDGNIVTIAIAPTAAVTGAGGRAGSSAALRRGMRVTVVAPANEPAQTILVEGIGP